MRYVVYSEYGMFYFVGYDGRDDWTSDLEKAKFFDGPLAHHDADYMRARLRARMSVGRPGLVLLTLSEDEATVRKIMEK